MADHCKEKLDNDSIFITTDKEHHDAGDTVVITGCIVDSLSSVDLSVQIINPENNVIKTSTLAPGIDGSFDTEYVIDEEFGLDGKYSAAVSLGNNSSTKTFTVPEFGSSAMIMLGVCITGIMFLALKSRITL